MNNTSNRLPRLQVDPSANVNEWTQLRNSGYMILFRVFFAAIAGATGCISGAKLIAYARGPGLSVSVGQVVLWLQLVASLYRASYVAVDPIYQSYTEMLAYQAHMTSSIHFSINAVTLLLLALYWKEILDRRKVEVAIFLSRMKIPFIILAVIAVTGEFLASSLRAANAGAYLPAILSGMIYLVILFSISIMFFVFGARVILQHENPPNPTLIRAAESMPECYTQLPT